MNKVLGDNFIHIFKVNEAIPDGLRIDHDHWAMLALIEASGLVGANNMLQSGILDGVLERAFELFAALGKTAWTRCLLVALVGADENVMLKFRHGMDSLLCLLRGYTLHAAF